MFEKFTESKFYIYRGYDIYGDIIYIGKTNNIHRRIHEHKTDTKDDWKKEIVRFDYAVFENDYESNFMERYCINKYKPKYNSEFKNVYSFNSCCHINFKNYVGCPVEALGFSFLVKMGKFYRKLNGESFNPEIFVNEMGITMQEWKKYVKYVLLNNMECISAPKNYQYTFIPGAMENLNYYLKEWRKNYGEINSGNKGTFTL